MKSGSLAMLFSAVLPGCNSSAPNPPERVDVSQVTENATYWDGSTVLVDGLLERCEGYDCHIADHAGPGSLSIGYTESFDEAAYSLQGKRVLLTAEVNAAEILSPGIDRSDQLIPVAITAWTPIVGPNDKERK